MNINEIMKSIVASSTYRKEVGASFQLGLPKFTVRNNELFVTFYPHLEIYSNQAVSYYPPQYEIELLYPFRHIVLFRNIPYTTDKGIASRSEPVRRIPVSDMTKNINSIRELFSRADDILRCREKDNADLQSLVLDYNKHYFITAESMGLQAIYGGTYDPHSCL